MKHRFPTVVTSTRFNTSPVCSPIHVRTKIGEIIASLKWPIENKPGGGDLEITSNPRSQKHIIRVPTKGAEWRDIEYLHELAHAVLAEQHHLLSTAWFTKSTEQGEITQLIKPFRIASDWFADHVLMQWCPDHEAAEILEHARYVINSAGHDMNLLYGGGLILAQAVYYLGTKRHRVPKRFRPVVDILLTVDPSEPSVPAKCTLINRLAALTCPQRVLLDREDGMDVWRIVKRASGKR